MLDHLPRRFQTPDWLDLHDVERDMRGFEQLDPTSVYRTAGSLGLIERLGKLPDEIEEIFEFGSGYGEGLITLNSFAELQNAKVVGSERVAHQRESASWLASTLHHVRGVDSDGLQTLTDSDEHYDLIVANMFGASYENSPRLGTCNPELAGLFLGKALTALTEGGVIAVNSDVDTMLHVYDWVNRNLESRQFDVIDPSTTPPSFKTQPHMYITR